VWADKVNSVFAAATLANKVMVPFELLQWCMLWSLPRMVESLSLGGHSIYQVIMHFYRFRFHFVLMNLWLVRMVYNFCNIFHCKQQSKYHHHHYYHHQVAAGDLHTAFLTTKGALFLCGSGPVVPPFEAEQVRRVMIMKALSFMSYAYIFLASSTRIYRENIL
jgi:hypothetical protein